MGKNPHASGTPEWQLFECMTSHELAASQAAENAEHELKRAERARDKAAAYRRALAKLGFEYNATPPLEEMRGILKG